MRAKDAIATAVVFAFLLVRAADASSAAGEEGGVSSTRVFSESGRLLFFTGSAMTHTALITTIVAASSDYMLGDGVIPLSIGGFACNHIGVPLSCLSARRAARLAGDEALEEEVRKCGVAYGLGCIPAAVTIGLVTAGSWQRSEGLLWPGLALFAVRDILWGYATFRANKVTIGARSPLKESRVSVYPQIAPTGGAGVAATLRF